MTCTIVRMSATSKLVIDVVLNVTNSIVNAAIITSLFQDATTKALATGWQSMGPATYPTAIVFRHVMPSGATGATTFRVRAGCITASTTTMNGQSGTRFMGGSLASSITIQEVA